MISNDPVIKNLINISLDKAFASIKNLYKNKQTAKINYFTLNNTPFSSLSITTKRDAINVPITYSYGLHAQISFILENDNCPETVTAYFSETDTLLPSLNSLKSNETVINKIKKIKLKRISKQGNKYLYTFPDQYLFMSRYNPVSKPLLFVIDFKNKKFATVIGVLGEAYPGAKNEQTEYGMHSSFFGKNVPLPIFNFTAIYFNPKLEPQISLSTNKNNLTIENAKKILRNSREIQTMLDYKIAFNQQLTFETK